MSWVFPSPNGAALLTPVRLTRVPYRRFNSHWQLVLAAKCSYCFFVSLRCFAWFGIPLKWCMPAISCESNIHCLFKTCAAGVREKTKWKIFLGVKNIPICVNSWFQHPSSVTILWLGKVLSFLKENCPPNSTLRQGEESEEEMNVSSCLVILFDTKS